MWLAEEIEKGQRFGVFTWSLAPSCPSSRGKIQVPKIWSGAMGTQLQFEEAAAMDGAQAACLCVCARRFRSCSRRQAGFGLIAYVVVAVHECQEMDSAVRV